MLRVVILYGLCGSITVYASQEDYIMFGDSASLHRRAILHSIALGG
ncbi:MAG: hypothetical protein HC890_17105 [Chloroflexaceae bacterium]|nr:hypothetical protein [Chloroflexaceae bacterium]